MLKSNMEWCAITLNAELMTLLDSNADRYTQLSLLAIHSEVVDHVDDMTVAFIAAANGLGLGCQYVIAAIH